jgi:hypothetical protein
MFAKTALAVALVIATVSSAFARPRRTAPTPHTTCSSTANTSALTRIRLSVQCSRANTASTDGLPSQVAAGCLAGPPHVGDQNFDFARWNY